MVTILPRDLTVGNAVFCISGLNMILSVIGKRAFFAVGPGSLIF